MILCVRARSITGVTDYPGGGAAARSRLEYYDWRDRVEKWIGKHGSSPCTGYTTITWEMGSMGSGNLMPKQPVGAWFVPGDPSIDPISVALKLRRRQFILMHQIEQVSLYSCN
jgi:hypothetical protein